MVSPETEQQLRQNWTPQSLGQYEGQWIAFKGEVLASAPTLSDVVDRMARRLPFAAGDDAVYAYVTFRARA